MPLTFVVIGMMVSAVAFILLTRRLVIFHRWRKVAQVTTGTFTGEMRAVTRQRLAGFKFLLPGDSKEHIIYQQVWHAPLASANVQIYYGESKNGVTCLSSPQVRERLVGLAATIGLSLFFFFSFAFAMVHAL